MLSINFLCIPTTTTPGVVIISLVVTLAIRRRGHTVGGPGIAAPTPSHP